MITKRKVREGEPIIATMKNKLAINTVEDYDFNQLNLND